MMMTGDRACALTPVVSRTKIVFCYLLTKQFYRYSIFTFIILFNPDPRFPRKPDPERSSRGDTSKVVDKCLGGAGVDHGRSQRRQIGADGVAVTIRLVPGRNAS